MAKKSLDTTATTTTETAGKFRGIGTLVRRGIPAGLRRMAFQDALLEWNRTARKSDAELAELMKAEHPLATGRIDEQIVAGIRRLYNAGQHTKANTRQAVPVPRYEAGKPVAEAARGAAKKAAAVATVAAKTAKTKTIRLKKAKTPVAPVEPTEPVAAEPVAV